MSSERGGDGIRCGFRSRRPIAADQLVDIGAVFPERQVQADFGAEHVVVYQAYEPAIADAAVRAGTFVAPFKRARMTWF